jgi:hypothetical protein
LGPASTQQHQDYIAVGGACTLLYLLKLGATYRFFGFENLGADRVYSTAGRI